MYWYQEGLIIKLRKIDRQINKQIDRCIDRKKVRQQIALNLINERRDCIFQTNESKIIHVRTFAGDNLVIDGRKMDRQMHKYIEYMSRIQIHR